MVHIKATCIHIFLSSSTTFLQNVKRSGGLGGRNFSQFSAISLFPRNFPQFSRNLSHFSAMFLQFF